MNKGDMILVYKILHGSLEGVQWRDFFQTADTSRLRGHSLKLKKEWSRLDLRKFTFSQRVVNMWNDLPADMVTALTTKVFKKLLEATLNVSLDGRQSNSSNTHRSSAFISILCSLPRKGFEGYMRYLRGLGSQSCNCNRLPSKNRG